MQINILPDWSLLVIAVLFFLNYLIVRNFFLRPINRILEDRETEVGSAQKKFEEALARFNQATAEIEAKLHQTRREASLVREQRRGEAVAHRTGLVEKTRQEGQRIVAEATARLQREVEQARQRILSGSESLARLAAERIIGRRIA
jgi:F-type H+-transporting ATPase subunit b